MRLRLAVVAYGLASLCSVSLFSPLVSPQHLAIYHLRGDAAGLFGPPLAYFCGFWIAFVGILSMGERFGWIRRLFWNSVVSVLPLLAVKSVAVLMGNLLPVEVTMTLVLMCPVTFAALLLFRVNSRQLAGAGETCFGIVTWAGVLLLGQVLWNFYAARGHTHEPALLKSPLVSAKPRVIWIVLDELSHAQMYERRFPGLKLPGFDALAHQATVFTNVVPTATMTDKALPALMTGVAVESIRATPDGRQFDVRSGSREPWRRFQARQTVFSDALREGYRTGVAGWYNPYCRILPEVLNACEWIPHRNTQAGGFISDIAFSRNLMAPVFSGLYFARHAAGLGADPSLMDDHIAEYRAVESAAFRMLNDSSLTFLLLHLAAPHPEGIYDRQRGEFTDNGKASYVDNLALADRFLQIVEARSDWEDSAVLVMGDHSWRTVQLWRDLPGWTQEDEEASGGRYDERPGYVVKVPGQHGGARVQSRFQALRTRKLLDALIRRELQGVEDVTRWVGSN